MAGNWATPQPATVMGVVDGASGIDGMTTLTLQSAGVVPDKVVMLTVTNTVP